MQSVLRLCGHWCSREVHIADDNGVLNKDNRLLFRVERKYLCPGGEFVAAKKSSEAAATTLTLTLTQPSRLKIIVSLHVRE